MGQSVIKATANVVSIRLGKSEIIFLLDTKSGNGITALAGNIDLVGIFLIYRAKLAKMISRIPMVRNSVAITPVFTVDGLLSPLKGSLAAMIVTNYLYTRPVKLTAQISEKIYFLLGGI